MTKQTLREQAAAEIMQSVQKQMRMRPINVLFMVVKIVMAIAMTVIWHSPLSIEWKAVAYLPIAVILLACIWLDVRLPAITTKKEPTP